MSAPCERVKDEADLLVRGEPPEELAAHARECAGCAAVLQGARSLARDLDAWRAPAADDLVERTLARLAVAGATPEPAGETIPFAAARRRSSVELLTEPPGSITSPIPPTRRQLVWRVLVQSAAAGLLAVVCTGLGAVLSPVVVQALEDKELDRCRARLQRVGEKVLLYRKEHPDAGRMGGAELRAALVEGGYLDETELLCPAHDVPGATGYALELPAPDELGDPPLVWDQFRHHTAGINVVYASGRAELVRAVDLGTWARRLRSSARE